MDGTGEHHVMLNNPDLERQISCFLSYSESVFFFKDMKVKQELFGKRKRACRREKGGQERGLG
jgi:hypothetical protein